MGYRGNYKSGKENPLYVEGVRENGKVTKLYNSWRGMKERCNNPNYFFFNHYGGRGISVCRDWNTFKGFRDWARANGYEEGLTIDRINNDGNYNPKNCKWVTKRINSRKASRKLTDNQVRKIKKALEKGARLSELGRKYSVTPQSIFAIKYGQSYGDIN